MAVVVYSTAVINSWPVETNFSFSRKKNSADSKYHVLDAFLLKTHRLPIICGKIKGPKIAKASSALHNILKFSNINVLNTELVIVCNLAKSNALQSHMKSDSRSRWDIKILMHTLTMQNKICFGGAQASYCGCYLAKRGTH